MWRAHLDYSPHRAPSRTTTRTGRAAYPSSVRHQARLTTSWATDVTPPGRDVWSGRPPSLVGRGAAAGPTPAPGKRVIRARLPPRAAGTCRRAGVSTDAEGPPADVYAGPGRPRVHTTTVHAISGTPNDTTSSAPSQFAALQPGRATRRRVHNQNDPQPLTTLKKISHTNPKYSMPKNVGAVL